MPTTNSPSADPLAGNQAFAQGIEQAQQVLFQRARSPQPAGKHRRKASPGVLERARGYARRHPLAATGTAALAAYLLRRVVRPRSGR